MERIRIENVEQKTTSAGKLMWKVTYNGNQTFNLFDNNAKEALFLIANKGQEVDVDFEMSKPNAMGKQYKNLKEVMMTNPSHEGTPMSLGMNDTQMPPTQHSMSARDASIVAQVCLKGAVELAKNHYTKLDNNEDIGEFLCMAVVELAGAYNVAFDKLNG